MIKFKKIIIIVFSIVLLFTEISIYSNNVAAGSIQTINLVDVEESTYRYNINTTNLVIISKSASISNVVIGSGYIDINFDPSTGTTTRTTETFTLNHFNMDSGHWTAGANDRLVFMKNIEPEYDRYSYQIIDRGQLWVDPTPGSPYNYDNNVDSYERITRSDPAVGIILIGSFSSSSDMEYYINNFRYSIDRVVTTYDGTIQYAYNLNPSVTVAAPSAGQRFSGIAGFKTINLSGTVRDTDVGDTLKVFYRIDGLTGQAGIQIGGDITANGANQAYTSTLDAGLITEGNHTLSFWVEDDKTGKSAETVVPIVIDKTGPSITFNPLNNHKVSSISMIPVVSQGNDASGVSKMYYVVKNEEEPTATKEECINERVGNMINLNMSSGRNYMYVYSVDSLGNESDVVRSPLYVINSKPGAGITGPGDGSWLKK